MLFLPFLPLVWLRDPRTTLRACRDYLLASFVVFTDTLSRCPPHLMEFAIARPCSIVNVPMIA